MDHPQSSQPDIVDTSPTRSPQSDQLAQARLPLSNRSNIHVDTAANWEHKDSSEDQPSTHDSICDAAWISTSDLAKSPYQTPGRPVTPLRSVDIDLDSDSPLSRLETPFLYGYGTELAPILEQRSITTLRTKGSLSTSDLSSVLHDAPGRGENRRKLRCKSDDTTAQIRQLRRQQSFSLEDITPDSQVTDQPVEPAPQLKCLAYSRPTVHLVDVHAYPRKPIYPPPRQPPTPPSLTKIRHPWLHGDAYVESIPNAIAYEAPDFRPPRSGHGNLTAHPFMQQVRTASNGSRPSASRGLQSRESAVARFVPNARRSHRGSAASPDNYPARRAAGTCGKCRRPRGEWWSLGSTLTGHGPGMRRGADWCGRCACRKIVRKWCCGE
ncbi:hypothetical protein F4861DRAFT_502660 [Xylaria intraflava]|nr:hypothetical protein F4861DRAFT_502660 [Xylaria intraflava]